MSNRTAKFVSAIFASFLAGAPLTTVSPGAARAAGDCLSEPKATTPEGSHWYFRIDHANQRKCWYVRSEGKVSQVTAPTSVLPKPASPKTVTAKTDTAMQPSVANARAEFPWPQTRIEPEAGTAPAPQTPAANAGNANTQGSPIAARWPGQADISAVANPQPTTSMTVASVPSIAKAAAPPATVAMVPLVAADASSKSQFGSLQWLTIIMGGLSLAGVMGSAIFRIGSRRWTGPREIQSRRRVNWDAASPNADARTMPGMDRPRDLRAADDPDRRIAEMLARLSRTAAT